MEGAEVPPLDEGTGGEYAGKLGEGE